MTPKPYFDENHHVLPFDKVMELEKIDDRTFRSIVKAYSPTGGENGTYGGHVYAQAAWAAAQTISEGFLLHNITGWFILGGKPSEHFVYTVHKIRDGYNYCTRSVTVTQVAEKGTMFTCTCSFKRDEPSSVDVQDTVKIEERFKEVLGGKENEPMEHPNAPSQDSEWFRETYLPTHPEHFNPVAGLHLRKVDMKKYNENKAAIDRRQLILYTLRGALPLPTAPYPPTLSANLTVTREANLHACAHLYASDRNSLFIIPNHLKRSREWTRMASLSHTVIFHVGIRDLVLPPEPRISHPNADPTLFDEGSTPLCNFGDISPDEKDGDGRKWYMQESWVSRAAGGRGLHMSRLWDYKKGTHIASTIQDGLIRFESKTKL
ncbi:acyl-CoA thioesteras-like protein [Aaosphaeria arxii CBS 175.79]|uniref:Acyl-CoA thioesteras-like protein n=1 Tax=Aaosphaeria arxii CBS 175.79 TaxID=1450172 RepID=A0A6A5XBC3_9PLEO|nr:acyl-CoA thioesteras-like protein [Aaosphaeria arxii CBS 175.79]KAF2010097.1 acyl-CoA thioesteras-like protein [Aaosphaeria arxii CBS 175.79]